LNFIGLTGFVLVDTVSDEFEITMMT